MPCRLRPAMLMPSRIADGVPHPHHRLLCVALPLLLLLVLPTSVRSEDIDSTATDPCRAQSDGVVSSATSSGGGCHINCFRADPVCGVNGVTYWCGCPDAACAGVRVARRGACQVGSSGSGLISSQAFLLVHIAWLMVLGFAVTFGYF